MEKNKNRIGISVIGTVMVISVLIVILGFSPSSTYTKDDGKNPIVSQKEKTDTSTGWYVISSISTDFFDVSFTYDSAGYLVSAQKVAQPSNPTEPDIITNYTYIYDTVNNTMMVFQKGSEEGWGEINRKAVYSFNDFGDVVSVEQQSLNWDVDEYYPNYFKYFYNYDANGNILSKTEKTLTNGIWSNEQRTQYIYNQKGELIRLELQFKENNGWQDERNYIYELKNNDRKLIEKYNLPYYQIFITEFGDRKSFVKDSVFGDTILQRVFFYGEWDSGTRSIYSFDTSGNLLTEILTQSFSENKSMTEYKSTESFHSDIDFRYLLNEEWEDRELKKITYDQAGNAISSNIYFRQNNRWTKNDFLWELQATINKAYSLAPIYYNIGRSQLMLRATTAKVTYKFVPLTKFRKYPFELEVYRRVRYPL